MVSFTTLALLATSALASPVARQVAIPENWNWQVEGWEAGCARRGCYYWFNITVPSVDDKISGVKAYCNGAEQGYDNSFTIPDTYTQCKLLEGEKNGVAAKLSPRIQDGTSRGPQEIFISFLDAAEDANSPYYNFSGRHAATYNQFVAPTLNFTVTPTEVFGIV